MIYNELFESIIRTSGENTDILDDFDDRDNFWAEVPVIERMFEQVLREMAILNQDQYRYSLETYLANYVTIQSPQKNYTKL